MSVRDLPWFVANCFVWWKSDPSGDPEDEFVGRRHIIATFALLLALILASLRIIKLLRQMEAL